MTIDGWIIFVVSGGLIVFCAACICMMYDGKLVQLTAVVAAILLGAGLFFGMRWYFTSTASGQRAMISEKSDIQNGIDRTVTIYTADGQIIAQYTGKIDLAEKAGGYVLFDFEGKRYTYYNCFIESIADIGG